MSILISFKEEILSIVSVNVQLDRFL